MRWAAHWPAVGDINRWDTHVVLVVDLASDRGSIPRASTNRQSSTIQRRPEMGAVARFTPLGTAPGNPHLSIAFANLVRNDEAWREVRAGLPSVEHSALFSGTRPSSPVLAFKWRRATSYLVAVNVPK